MKAAGFLYILQEKYSHPAALRFFYNNDIKHKRQKNNPLEGPIQSTIVFIIYFFMPLKLGLRQQD